MQRSFWIVGLLGMACSADCSCSCRSGDSGRQTDASILLPDSGNAAAGGDYAVPPSAGAQTTPPTSGRTEVPPTAGQDESPAPTDNAGQPAPEPGNGVNTGWDLRFAPGASWQWQLTGDLDESVDAEIFDIDLFNTPASTIARLQGAGHKVICYFSAGSREDWREDAQDFAAGDYGQALDGWPGENWLDVRSENVRRIMAGRLELAQSKGCNAVEPDNVDGYANRTGFALREADQLDYNRFLAQTAHALGLSVGLKNSVELAARLEPDFDWALNEECLTYDECDTLQAFIAAGKAVFHTEYVDDVSQASSRRTQVCRDPSRRSFSTLIKTWDLGPEFFACD